MTQHKVIISTSYERAIDFSENNSIKINPKLFLKRIRQDFNRYINSLKDLRNTEMRERFNRMFSNLQEN